MRKPVVLGFTLLCAISLTAKTEKKTAADWKQFDKKLSKDEQILHALDRMGFGPRPGEIDEVKKIGLKKWIDQQLHPEHIKENPLVEARLAPLESLRMSQEQTAANYPPQQVIRAIAEGRQPLPADPVARAAAERLVRRYKVKRDAGQDPNAAAANQNMELQPAVAIEDLLPRDQIRVLRNGTVEQKREILASYPEAKLDDLVIAMPPPLRNQVMAAAPPPLRHKLMQMNQPQQVIFSDLVEGKLYRAVYSNRQLEEVLTDFWFNHFNVFLDKGADRFMVPTYERDAIRPHVLGKFRDLLEATASSPAMLFYLDNWQSVANGAGARGPRGPAANRPRRGLNENYARELMELHTLGVDGGYTQKDIIEVARCFTGWTIRNPQQGGEFQYNDRVHDKGEKTVLGVKISAGGGKGDAEKVLDILAKHPSTARFISKKLAQRFVADEPPPALIDRMAKTFTDTDGDIREVMKTMLNSKEFFSEGAYRAKVKTPFEMIASALRATDAQVDYALPLAQQIGQLGEPLYRKIEPTGYSSANAEWISSASLLGRMNFAIQLTQNKVPGVKVDQAKWPDDPSKAAKLMLFADATPQTKEAIVKALADQKAKDPKSGSPALLAGLVLGSPDFQKR